MTSPDGSGIPTGAVGQRVGDWSVMDDIAQAITDFFGGIPIIGDIVEALMGKEDGDYTDLGTWANLILGRDVSLASRVSAIENKIAVGAEFFDNFKRGDNDSVLGSPQPGTVANWIQFGEGQPLGIHDQAAQLRRDALPGDGTQFARCPFLATSDNYTVSAVIHPKGTPPNARTSLYGRCNADGTEGVYVDFYGDHCTIGRFTRSGLTVNRSQWGPNSSKTYSNSSTPQLMMDGNRYKVVIDDTVVIDWVDTSGFPINAAHRTTMFSLNCWTGFLAVPQFSGGLASIAIRNKDLTAVQQAQTTATNAQTTATGAQNTANTAQSSADVAYNNAAIAYAAAARWKDEFIVSSAGVILGKNELALGVVMDVPPGRTRKISRIIYGLITNTGALNVDLIVTTPARVSTVIHTTTIPAGQLEFIDDNIDYSVADGARISCNVTSIGGNSSVLQCAVIGALL